MTTPIIKFDNYLFNSELDEITFEGEVFRLEHQQANLLLLLLKNNQKIVTRDQIAKEIWQGIIVEDNTITKAITRLRKVLNDSAKSPRFIKTIPKKGYQFIADFEEIFVIPDQDIPKVRHFTTKNLVFFFILFTLGFIAFLAVQPEKQAKQSFPAQSSPITYREGLEYSAHLHPNGKQLLFMGSTNKGYAIFHKKLSAATPTLLLNVSSRYIYPKWLPSGNAFVFSRINSLGQCNIVSTTIDQPHQSEVLSPCLSNVPVEVFVNNNTKKLTWSDSSGVWQFNIDSGVRQQLPFSHEHVDFQLPSPDYQSWATLTQKNEKSVLSIYDIESQNLLYTKLLPYQINHFKWSYDGKALYHLSEHPSHQLIKQSIDNQEEVIATTSFGFISQVSDVQNKNTIEFVISAIDTDIARVTATEETMVVNSTFRDYNPSLSPNLTSLAFASKRTGSAQIWLKKSNDEYQQLTQFARASYIYTIAWSPDNKMLLVKRNDSLYIIDVDSKKSTKLPINAEDKFTWQWVSNNSIAYIDKRNNSLFYFDINNFDQQLVKTNIGYAQLIDQHWYVSDSEHKTLSRYDAVFSQGEIISQYLNERFWLMNDQQLYVFTKDPNSLVRINKDGSEETLLKGPSVNPFSVKNAGNGDFIYHKISQNEATIYQLRSN